MANTTITKILCRRGPEADRTDITPTMGEPIWTTDTHRFYVGDGETIGARPVVDVDSKYFVFKEQGPTDTTLQDIPPTGSTKHNVLTFADQIDGDIITTGRIVSLNTANGCGNVAAIHASGGISCGSDLNVGGDVISFCTSDIKFKENITNIENPLTKIQKINGVTFEWNDDQDTYQGVDTGLIAQEVESLQLPGVCMTREDGTKAVKYEKIIPLLVECIKQLNDKIERLENNES